MTEPLPYPSPPLTDGTVALRPWSLGDVACIQAASLDPGILGLRPQAGVIGLGDWVIPEARGQGLAGPAARVASDWVLSSRGEHRVEAWVEPGNLASQRVLERAGFAREGVLRSFLSFEGRRADAIVYARIAGD